MIANPGGPRWKLIDAERERRRIDQAIGDHQKAGRVNLRWVPGDTAEDLLTMVSSGDWHVFHFVGHGGLPSVEDDAGAVDEAPEGFIVLGDGRGGYHEVRASELRLMLQGRGAGSLRLVVLNCCDSARGTADDALASPAAALVRAGIPAVVAMQFPISDEAAVQLSSVFYEKLADGWAVEAALTQARQMMWAKSRIEWGIPVLYMRSKSGRLFTPASAVTRGPARAGPASVTDQRTIDARARLRELYHDN
jgi:CHAT domain-containing protein